MKFIIFGIGQALRKRISLINIDDVACFTDNSVHNDSILYGKPLVSPNRIRDFKYDVIIISSYKYFNDIKTQLINTYWVHEEKIAGIECFLSSSIDHKTRIVTEGCVSDLLNVIKTFGVHSVIDFGDGLVAAGVLDKTDVRLRNISKGHLQIIGVGNNQRHYSCSLYDRKYDALSEAGYDIDAGINLYMCDDSELVRHCRYTFRILPWKWRTDGKSHQSVVTGYYSDIEVIDNKSIKPEMRVYVVGHRDFRLKSRATVYRRIMAGSHDHVPDGYLSDMSGHSISSYNERINELTSLYWIWKNTQEDIVGLCHYRRYFCNYDDGLLTGKDIERFMEEYDMVVSNATIGTSQADIIRNDVGENAYNEAYDIMKNHISEEQRDYLDAFEYVMHSDAMYPCNMFITKKGILDKYCNFLFSFIIDAAKEYDISDKCSRAKRTIGFFAERMLTVWLLKQDYNICQLPVKFFEDM